MGFVYRVVLDCSLQKLPAEGHSQSIILEPMQKIEMSMQQQVHWKWRGG